MELRDQIAVGGVDLHAVEPSVPGTQGGGDMSSDRLRDALLRHLFRNDGLECRFIDRMRDRRGRNRRLTADVSARVSSRMTELDRYFRSGCVQRLDQAAQPGNEAIIINADFAPAMPSRPFRGGHLDGDKTDAAAGP